ncbi:MAG: type II CRISPR RNA-guided endonuclease Cas9 [Alphaproteobacteria bacterium]|nr:type II CRISPR RNA-guided endonuclease Cas9 [Alphaproteobacteria bacterium]
MRVFGFDLGIASIGWAVVDIEKENNNPEMGRATVGKIQQSGVRIFSVAENPKDGSSLAAPRREKRSIRRALRRKALRMKEIRTLLENSGLGNQNIVVGADDVDVWALRAEDVFYRKLSSRELSRVLIHMAKHRGYKSMRKSAEENDKETGKVLVSIARNRERMGEYKTMAQMIYKNNCDGAKKYRNGDGVYDNSIPREEIERELDLIFDAQQKYGLLTPELREQYKKIAFRVRPIQSVGKMVGGCTLEPNCLRAPKESPTAELFVALTRINNMKMVIDGAVRSVNDEERAAILDLLRKTQTVKYKTLRNKIWKGHDVAFRGVKEETQTFYSMAGWHKLKKILDSADMSDVQMLDRIMKVIATQKDDAAIEKELRRKKVPEKHIAELKTLSTSKFINLSLQALYKIVPEMMRGLTYDKACAAAGYDFKSKISGEVKADNGCVAEIAEWTRVPVVNRTVAQFRKVYNALVRKYGTPDRVNLEVGRELKNNFDDRKKIERQQNENRDKNDSARTEYEALTGRKATAKDVVKYKLYRDQDGKCMYSGEAIDLAHLDSYEIDHILPYSRSLDNSYMNKVLVKYTENQAKGNKTPYEYFGNTARWDDFAGRVSALKVGLGTRKVHNLLNKDFDASEEDFRERNEHDNAYAARYVKQVLNTAFPDLRVDVRAGALTHYLRGQWGLTKSRTESDRHHAQDAIVIACATPGMVQYLSTVSGLFENKRNEKGRPWWDNLKQNVREPWDGFRADVLQSVDDVFVSRTVRGKATGSVHKDTINSPKSGKGSMVLPRGRADKDNMFRMDIFKKDGKYVVVPIFVADTVDKNRQDIFYPQPAKAEKPVAIDDTYEFVMTLHKDDYIKITTKSEIEYEGYVVKCTAASNQSQLVIRSLDNSARFSVRTDTFEPDDIIKVENTLYKVSEIKNGKLIAISENGIIFEIEAQKKQKRGGVEEKKKIKTLVELEKCDSQKKIDINTFKNLQKFHIGVLGDVNEVKCEHRTPVCAIKPQSEKRKGRKQPKRNKNGVANPSTNETV